MKSENLLALLINFHIELVHLVVAFHHQTRNLLVAFQYSAERKFYLFLHDTTHADKSCTEFV